MFLKVFFLRVGYSFLKLIIQYKKFQKLNLILLLKVIFSFSNIRTSLSISFLPLSYKILKILYRHLFGKHKHANITTIIFGLFSGILSIIMEEKTRLVKLFILSISVRVIHLIILSIINKYEIMQSNERIWDYIKFTFATFLIWSVYFLNPEFRPITGLFDKYSTYDKDSYELFEARVMRNSTRIV